MGRLKEITEMAFMPRSLLRACLFSLADRCTRAEVTFPLQFTAQDQAGSDEEDESADEDYQPQKDEDWKKVS